MARLSRSHAAFAGATLLLVAIKLLFDFYPGDFPVKGQAAAFTWPIVGASSCWHWPGCLPSARSPRRRCSRSRSATGAGSGGACGSPSRPVWPTVS
jgi:hypothetical protein